MSIAHQQPQLTLVEKTLMHHQAQIDHIKDNAHDLEKNIIALRAEVREVRHDVKALLSRFDIYEHLDNRVEAIEAIHKQRKWLLNLIPTTLNIIQKYWMTILLIVLLFFAFDINVEVKNPHLLEFIKSKINF